MRFFLLIYLLVPSLALAEPYTGQVVNLFATNPDLDTPTVEDIWHEGGAYSFLATSSALEIVSADTDDDGAPAGTGCRTVEVRGLTSAYVEQEETVILNGTTAVDLTLEYYRINSIECVTFGSQGENDGQITLRVDGAGSTVATIEDTHNHSRMIIYSVPANKTLRCKSWHVSPNFNETGNAQFQLHVLKSGAGKKQVASTALIDTGNFSSHVDFGPGLVIEGGSDLIADGITTASNYGAHMHLHCYLGFK